MGVRKLLCDKQTRHSKVIFKLHQREVLGRIGQMSFTLYCGARLFGSLSTWWGLVSITLTILMVICCNFTVFRTNKLVMFSSNRKVNTLQDLEVDYISIACVYITWTHNSFDMKSILTKHNLRITVLFFCLDH